MSHPRKIVYASSLVLPDPGTLATLALLYDEVHLPHAYDVDPDGERLMRWSSANHLDKLDA